MPVDVVVKLAVAAPDAARRTAEACGREAGVSLAPLHPDASDRDLASYYMTTVAPEALDTVLARLGRCPGVDAAYAKPAGEPPGRM